MPDLKSFPDRLSYQAADRSEAILDLSIGDVLRNAAAAWPDRVALVDGNPDGTRRWTFAKLLSDAEAVARALLGKFTPGEHVAVWAANQPEWVLIEFGAALAGVTLVTVNPAYLRDELAFVLKQSQARGVIVQDLYRNRDLLAIVDEAGSDLPELREVIPLSTWPDFVAGGKASTAHPVVPCNDVAQIQYTSGTTGAPKGARLTHRNLANNARFYARAIGAGTQDVWINPMPMFHTAGCSLCTLGALQTGGTHVLLPGFDADHMLRLIEEERGSIVLCVPTMLGRMLDAPDIAERDLSSWRLVTMGGAPVAPELVRRAQARGLEVGIGFGQTEASPYITHTLPNDPHPDWITTVGRPLPQTEIKIIDPDSGDTVPRGQIGEICARGYCLMKDYFNDPKATASAIDAEGWLHTADLGSLDQHGYCRIQGRRRDLIIRGGENIYPREIEDLLHMHPAVLDASVVGIPDADLGEVPVGFVVLKPDEAVDADGLMQFCRARLASYKVPRIWRFVDQFPQTASGKTQKFKLRADYLGNTAAG